MSSPYLHGGVLQASQEHVTFCFEVLTGHFNGASAPLPNFEDVHWYAAKHITLYQGVGSSLVLPGHIV